MENSLISMIVFFIFIITALIVFILRPNRLPTKFNSKSSLDKPLTSNTKLNKFILHTIPDKLYTFNYNNSSDKTIYELSDIEITLSRKKYNIVYSSCDIFKVNSFELTLEANKTNNSRIYNSFYIQQSNSNLKQQLAQANYFYTEEIARNARTDYWRSEVSSIMNKTFPKKYLFKLKRPETFCNFYKSIVIEDIYNLDIIYYIDRFNLKLKRYYFKNFEYTIISDDVKLEGELIPQEHVSGHGLYADNQSTYEYNYFNYQKSRDGTFQEYLVKFNFCFNYTEALARLKELAIKKTEEIIENL